jgi:hypothetical protein
VSLLMTGTPSQLANRSGCPLHQESLVCACLYCHHHALLFLAGFLTSNEGSPLASGAGGGGGAAAGAGLPVFLAPSAEDPSGVRGVASCTSHTHVAHVDHQAYVHRTCTTCPHTQIASQQVAADSPAVLHHTCLPACLPGWASSCHPTRPPTHLGHRVRPQVQLLGSEVVLERRPHVSLRGTTLTEPHSCCVKHWPPGLCACDGQHLLTHKSSRRAGHRHGRRVFSQAPQPYVSCAKRNCQSTRVPPCGNHTTAPVLPETSRTGCCHT